MLQIMLNRLKPQAEKIIAEEKAGFRAGRSTTKQIFNVGILCDKYFQHQKDLYHVFIDFKKAFDRVWRTGLRAAMKNAAINNSKESNIQTLYEMEQYITPKEAIF